MRSRHACSPWWVSVYCVDAPRRSVARSYDGRSTKWSGSRRQRSGCIGLEQSDSQPPTTPQDVPSVFDGRGRNGAPFLGLHSRGLARFESQCRHERSYLGAGDNVTTFSDPTYLPELPSERDIEKHREGMRRAFGVAPSETELLQFAQTPKRAFVRGRALAYDVWGRLWAATQRDRDKFSYLNVFSDTTYAGSVRVRHRVEGFDLLDSVLAVLVERPPDDPDGIPTRGIDWYRIESPRP